MPIAWACKEQIAVSHCSTKAEFVDTIIDMHPQGGGFSKRVHQTRIPRHDELFGDVEYVRPNARLFSIRTALYVFEDHESVIKQISKGTGLTMRRSPPVETWNPRVFGSSESTFKELLRRGRSGAPIVGSRASLVQGKRLLTTFWCLTSRTPCQHRALRALRRAGPR